MVFGLATIAFNGFQWFWTIGQTMRWFRWIVVVYIAGFGDGVGVDVDVGLGLGGGVGGGVVVGANNQHVEWWC